MGNMPRKVTIDDMVDAIRDAGKPCTKQDIADRTDVSRQTIANHADELESDPRVDYGKVGTANAYWLVEDDEPEGLDDPPDDVGQRRETSTETGGDDSTGDIAEAATDDDSESSEESESEDDKRDILTQLAERLAHPRVMASGALMLFIATVFLRLGANMLFSAALTPGAVMVGLAAICLQLGTGLVVAAAVAQWYLERPLKELVLGIDLRTSEVDA